MVGISKHAGQFTKMVNSNARKTYSDSQKLEESGKPAIFQTKSTSHRQKNQIIWVWQVQFTIS
jgi:hypothetical protein